MYIKGKLFNQIRLLFREFKNEILKRTQYEILNIYVCQKTSVTKAEIKLAGRHIIEKNIAEIVTDFNLLEGFDKKTIRTLTYLATVERFEPAYSIALQQLGNEVDDYILEIRSKNGKKISNKKASEMTKDKSLIAKFSPLDANRIGYLAGIKDTVKEFEMKYQK